MSLIVAIFLTLCFMGALTAAVTRSPCESECPDCAAKRGGE